MPTSLTFDALRAANIERLPQFKNKHGGLAHSKPDGSDWSPAQWLQAVVGELGEYANIRKKFERGDLTAEEFAVEAAKELADVQTYLDILAFQVGVDLGAASIAKFNEVSVRVGCDVRLGAPAGKSPYMRTWSDEELEAFHYTHPDDPAVRAEIQRRFTPLVCEKQQEVLDAEAAVESAEEETRLAEKHAEDLEEELDKANARIEELEAAGADLV